MGEIIKISVTDLTSGIDKEHKEYRFCDWVSGKPERITCYGVNGWKPRYKGRDRLGEEILKFRNAEEVKKFARWLLANVKGKYKEELLKFKNK